MVKKRKEINWSDVEKHIQQPVMIEFWDHSKNYYEGLIMCSVCGFLYKTDKKSITICAWDCPSFENNEDRVHNMEYFTILKSAVVEILPLKIAKKFG